MFGTIHVILYVVSISIILSSTESFASKNCTYDYHIKSPEVYYINLKRSLKRRKSMSQLLSAMKLNHHRIQAITSSSAYIPNDLIPSNYDNNNHGHKSDESVPDVCKYKTKEAINTSLKTMQSTNKTHFIYGICTRRILWTELGCTMSHLLAIYRAVHSTTSTSKYALIMEDDIHIPISTDYNALAESAPSDFGILQLMTVNRQLLR